MSHGAVPVHSSDPSVTSATASTGSHGLRHPGPVPFAGLALGGIAILRPWATTRRRRVRATLLAHAPAARSHRQQGRGTSSRGTSSSQLHGSSPIPLGGWGAFAETALSPGLV